VCADDPLNDGQTQAAASEFRAEERIEDFRFQRLRHTTAVIRNLQPHVISFRHASRARSQVRVAQVRCGYFNDPFLLERARAAHRVMPEHASGHERSARPKLRVTIEIALRFGRFNAAPVTARSLHLLKVSSRPMKTDADLRRYRIAIVIGVDHKIQYFIPGLAPDDPRTLLRLQFHEFLREATFYPVDVICEEANYGLVSIAERVADREHLRYCNIEVSPQRRAELGIPLLFTVDVPGSEASAEQTAKWNALLESHMFHELLGAITGARAVIVICGVIHMPAIIQALRTKFTRVEQYDVTKLAWFDQTLL
jgi:hypothetical protein